MAQVQQSNPHPPPKTSAPVFMTMVVLEDAYLWHRYNRITPTLHPSKPLPQCPWPRCCFGICSRRQQPLNLLSMASGAVQPPTPSSPLLTFGVHDLGVVCFGWCSRRQGGHCLPSHLFNLRDGFTACRLVHTSQSTDHSPHVWLLAAVQLKRQSTMPAYFSLFSAHVSHNMMELVAQSTWLQWSGLTEIWFRTDSGLKAITWWN